ncbi:hypothetical protein ACFPU0_04660 [Pseudomonas sp. GCM10022186]|uniref:hypothetical protein n=1 Tax=Pseudomonas sp. GCM10022186 TaxID=3252650 RepID=UPI00360DC635
MGQVVTREQERAIWTIALATYGSEVLEQQVCRYIEALLLNVVASELPWHVSAEGLAQAARLLLDDLASNERPLLAGLRTMNRAHYRALRQIRTGLAFALLADLPADLLPQHLHRLKVQVDLSA